MGEEALYLALTIEGMFLEMGHGLAYRFDPLTVCSYGVDVSDIVDLRSESGRNAVRVSLGDLGCAWALDLPKAGSRPRGQLARNFAALVPQDYWCSRSRVVLDQTGTTI